MLARRSSTPRRTTTLLGSRRVLCGLRGLRGVKHVQTFLNGDRHGAIPTGFTRATTATTWTLASTIGVKAQKANSISTAYTLNAQLATAPAIGVIWTVDAVALTTGIQALTAAGVYGATPTYAWSILIPDSLATASAVDNVVQFSAVAG